MEEKRVPVVGDTWRCRIGDEFSDWLLLSHADEEWQVARVDGPQAGAKGIMLDAYFVAGPWGDANEFVRSAAPPKERDWRQWIPAGGITMTRMAKPIDSRQETKHAKGCSALEHVRVGSWDSPWALGEHVFLTKQGTAGGPKSGRPRNTSWLRFRCNTYSCEATVVVRSSDVLSHVPHGEASR